MKTLLIFCATFFLLLSAFNTKKKTKLKLPEEFAYIPAGTMYVHVPGEDSAWQGKVKRPVIDSSRFKTMGRFYISKFEVTNLQYRQFYNDVSAGMTEGEKEKILCDSTGWRTELSYNEPLVEYYYRHPAYNNYPVVNISYEGASAYCSWLQKKLQANNPDFVIEVRLADKLEWIYAARGGRAQAMFPWGKYYLTNNKGQAMCNFRKVQDGAVYRNRQTGKPEIADAGNSRGYLNSNYYTAPVKSFYPNDYGLYNMCGNVAEMVKEKGVAMGGSWNDYGADVHIKAEVKYTESAPTVGFRPIIKVSDKTK